MKFVEVFFGVMSVSSKWKTFLILITTEIGFVKAKFDNLRKIKTLILTDYFKSNHDMIIRPQKLKESQALVITFEVINFFMYKRNIKCITN